MAIQLNFTSTTISIINSVFGIQPDGPIFQKKNCVASRRAEARQLFSRKNNKKTVTVAGCTDLWQMDFGLQGARMSKEDKKQSH